MRFADWIDLKTQWGHDRMNAASAAGWDRLEKRDQIIATQIDTKCAPIRLALLWLAHMRTHPDQPAHRQPGRLCARAESGLFVLSLALALPLGFTAASVALSLTRVGGPESWTFNLPRLWMALIGWQVLLLALSLTFFPLARWRGRGVLAAFSRSFVATLLRWGRSRWRDDDTAHLEALLQDTKQTGPIVLARLFTRLQWIAVTFNLGLGLALLQGEVQQFSFTWSSTRVESQWMAQTAESLSIPWRTVAPQAALSAADFSALRDDLPQPSRGDQARWWYFLLANLGVYALLPRLVLAVLGQSHAQRLLRNRLRKDDSLKALVNRLRGGGRIDRTSEPRDREGADVSATRTYRTLLWGTIPETISPALQHHLLARYPQSPPSWTPVGAAVSLAPDQAVLDALRNDSITDVVLLLPAWNEPVLDVTRFLRAARKAMGPDGHLWLELFDLRGDHELLPLNASDRRNWELALQEWADDGLIPRTLPDRDVEEGDD